MRDKFIKLTTNTYEWYVDPFMIASIGKSEGGNVVIYLHNRQVIYPDQTLEEVMKLIKSAGSWKFEI